MTSFRNAFCRLVGAVASCAVGVVLCAGPAVGASTGTSTSLVVASATTQQVLTAREGLTVLVAGRSVSALPIRLRILNQASPLAYSLDLEREVAYGDAWEAVSLGRPDVDDDRLPSQTGLDNPIAAQKVAVAPFPPGLLLSSEEYLLEVAARQVAIWGVTNDLPLVPATVPDPRLLARATELTAAAASGPPVELQAAYHSVQLFIRETTPNTVRLAVVIGLDPNTRPSTRQNIDLYLDGLRCPIRTGERTTVTTESQTCHTSATDLGPSAPREIAEVTVDRNTKVVDAEATWVNVRSDPGLVLASSGTAPPLMTAEPATFNFTGSARLDPDGYTDPAGLLNKAGVAVLTEVPGWLVWVLVLAALYVIPRTGRIIDAGVVAGWNRWRSGGAAALRPTMVEVTAPSVDNAVAAGVDAVGDVPEGHIVKVDVLHIPASDSAGQLEPVKIRISVSPPPDPQP